ncbi:aspartate racemase [Streptomyces capparidis]
MSGQPRPDRGPRGYTRTIGIVGGLGPLAGANFYRCVVEAAEAGSDQEHPRVAFVSDPAVPSRIAHLQGRGPSPLPQLTEVCRTLVAAGAGVLAVPSVTTHAYVPELAARLPVPVVDALDAAAAALRDAGAARVALAVTTPARDCGLLERRLAEAGISCVHPGAADQSAVQAVVEGVKAGRPLPELARRLDDVLAGPWAREADTALIGCTDISPLAAHIESKAADIARIYARAVLDAAV